MASCKFYLNTSIQANIPGNQVNDSGAFCRKQGRLEGKDYGINIESSVLDMPEFWDTCWTTKCRQMDSENWSQGGVRIGDSGDTCVLFKLWNWDQPESSMDKKRYLNTEQSELEMI